MSILPTGSSRTQELQSQRDSQAFQHRAWSVEQAARTEAWQSQNREALEALRVHSHQQGMEVRLHVMPQSNRIVLRFVDPSSGQVIREFPSEGLAQALAELQQKFISKSDELAVVDQCV